MSAPSRSQYLRELVYEGNTGRQQRIGAVFDHLGGVGIGIDEFPGQAGEQTHQLLVRYLLWLLR